jgi:mRNA interferase RelE/StbE
LVRIEWTERALEDLGKLDKPIARRILKKVTWFSNNFQSIAPEPLGGELKGTFKLRIGYWRVVYTLEHGVIVIQYVGHRGEIYRLRR